MVFAVRTFVAKQKSSGDTFGAEETTAFSALIDGPVPEKTPHFTAGAHIKHISDHYNLPVIKYSA
jgi:hypothetical protein